jgi:hypothetical protein
MTRRSERQGECVCCGNVQLASRVSLLLLLAQGYWRLEDIDEDHRTWPFHVDSLIPLVRRAAAL